MINLEPDMYGWKTDISVSPIAELADENRQNSELTDLPLTRPRPTYKNLENRKPYTRNH